MDDSRRSPDPIPAASGGAKIDTLADLMIQVMADESLSASRRRDCTSAIRRLAQILGRSPNMIPAEIGSLRASVSRISPEQHGVANKTWANIRANTLAALRLAGVTNRSYRKVPLSAEWKSVQRSLPDKRFQAGLGRFLRFCDSHGIRPADVDDPTMSAFRRYLETGTLTPRPAELHRRTCQLWNAAAQSINGFPARPVSVPSNRKPLKHRPWEELPEPFRQDVDAYLRWLSGADLFAANPPRHICKPSTLATRRRQIQGAASTALRTGLAPDGLSSLADLVAIGAVKAVLQHYCTESGKVTQYTIDLAEALASIAHQWVKVAPEHQDQLRGFVRELIRRGPKDAFTAKNRQAIAQFDDKQTLARLLHLPDLLLCKAKKKRLGSTARAVCMQKALAIGILTVAPMRISNLAGLRLDRHVARPDGPGGELHLIIPGDETKNERPLHFSLSGDLVELFERYLTEALPQLGPEDGPWLFPGEGGGHKRERTQSQQITETLATFGIVLTPHQFRHLAAKLLLDRNPGAFEIVRRLLGHKDIRTTIRFYAQFDMEQAAKHFDQEILRLRQENPLRPRRGPRGKQQ